MVEQPYGKPPVCFWSLAANLGFVGYLFLAVYGVSLFFFLAVRVTIPGRKRPRCTLVTMSILVWKPGNW